MIRRLHFNRYYFILTISLFLTEILIAKYLDDKIIRPYGGDFLVVILIYCFIKSFFDTSIVKTSIGVLLFSFLIETLQYFDIASRLGLKNYKIARIVIGTSFSWTDIIAYVLGILTVVSLEYLIKIKIRATGEKFTEMV